ncbi:MAG: TetR/AcrR family transcriptional regulator, partial [Desulfobacterales bacterium]|nr:TetR/AcrR family transcriptional regulator [Desulfobacterales bacterium]
MKKKAVRLEKEHILEVAVKLFGERGFSATSIREIANKLDISVAALYYYFNSKEDLLFTIIESIGNDLLDILRKAKEDSDDPLQQLKNMMVGQICLVPKKRNGIKVFVEEQHNLSTADQKVIYQQHRKIYDIYVEQLKELKQRNILAFDPPFLAAFAMFGMINWCYRWYRENNDLKIDQV